MSVINRLPQPDTAPPQWYERPATNAAAWFALLTRSPRARALSVPWRSSPRLVFSAVFLIALIAAAIALIDHWAIVNARLLSPPFIAKFQQITEYGTSGWVLYPLGVSLIALGIAAPFALPRMSQAFLTAIVVRLSFLFLAVAVPGLFVAMVKRLIGRARPFIYDDMTAYVSRPFGWSNEYASFPSGHSTTAFSVLIAFGALWPALRPVLWLYALLIALSRVIVSAHHPSDVIAGAVVGTVGALLVRDWFAARRLAFVVGSDGRVRPMPGPYVWRVWVLLRKMIGLTQKS